MMKCRQYISFILVLVLFLNSCPVLAAASEIEETDAGELVLDQIQKTEEMAIAGSDEEGLITFTTFADLKKLAAGNYTDYTCLRYAGNGPLTISEDLAIPENVMLDLVEMRLVVPAGITFTTGTHTNLHYLTVKGTLNCYSMHIGNEAIIEGKIVCKEVINLWETCTFTGIDNVAFTTTEGSVIRTHFPEPSMSALKKVLAVAAEEPKIKHNISVSSEENFLTESVTFPSNTNVHFEIPEIPKGITVTSDGVLGIYNEVTVNGKLINNGLIHFDQTGEYAIVQVASGGSLINNGVLEVNCSGNGKVQVASGGSYSGSGSFRFYAGVENVDFTKVAVGIDLSTYKVEKFAENGFYSWSYSPGDTSCSLSELTPADYVALSELAYLDFDAYAYWVGSNFEIVGIYKTVQECLTAMGKWNSYWDEERKITYAQLCAHIADWKILAYENDSNSTGFYAVVFKNSGNEAVISYRGSVPLDEVEDSNGADAILDWLVNDIPMQVMNKVVDDKQYQRAFDVYEKVAAGGRAASQIAVTGHSLGGGLGNLVAAKYGCKGNTVNAISVLDAVFYHAPEVMGENYTGIDKWTFSDHANKNDVIAGMYEHYFGTKIKPYTAYETSVDMSGISVNELLSGQILGATVKYYAGKLISCHLLPSLVNKNSSGEVTMTAKDSSFRVLGWKKSELGIGLKRVDFGSSSADTISDGFLGLTNRASFGGDGKDYITTGNLADTLLGGKGDDTLDGGWGDDKYVYYKGHGVDVIHDTDGKDILYLYNFSKNDKITMETDSDKDYILVKYGNTTIVKIAKKGRKNSSSDTFKVIVENTDGSETTMNITSGFDAKKFKAAIRIACPVYVEILDAEGNVVYTLEDGVVGSHYTEYGNFYVYEEEDGSYGKVLELVEGYTAKAVGTADGMMDVSYQPVLDEGLGELQTLEDVAISESFVATVEETKNGDAILVMDTDGDGAVDQTVKIGTQAHEEEILAAKEATCTEAGLTEGKKCAVCGEILVAQEEIPAKGHAYDNDKDLTCNVCGEERDVEQEKPEDPAKPETIETTPMYRLYNPNSGEHFYTANEAERDMLVGYGWTYEGVAWYAPTKVGELVYRLYNPNAGEHHYTTSAAEREMLVSYGWNDEGIGWLTAGADQEPVYRVYNPNEFANNHHYTRDTNERDWLVSLGWVDEGIGWYGVRN